MNYLNAEDSAKWLAENKILLHPTEGVWGIGCNAKSSKAVDRIFDLKKRDKSKKFILLSPSIDSVKEFCSVLKETKNETLSMITSNTLPNFEDRQY